MKPWIQRWRPTSGVLWTPTDAWRVNLYSRVRPSGLENTRVRQDAAISEDGRRGVPTAVRHILHIGEDSRCWIVDGIFRLTFKRIVLDGPAVDEYTAVGQHDHAVAKHVPRERLGCNRT